MLHKDYLRLWEILWDSAHANIMKHNIDIWKHNNNIRLSMLIYTAHYMYIDNLT